MWQPRRGGCPGGLPRLGPRDSGREEGTVTWYAFELSDTTYGIFDTFASEDDKNAHLAGGIPVAFPDYELTDHTKTRRRLGELQGIDPMILLSSRGSFCPKDHQRHLELAANYPKIAVAYTQLVTISTDNILETSEFRAQAGAQWTFLSDAGPRPAPILRQQPPPILLSSQTHDRQAAALYEGLHRAQHQVRPQMAVAV